MGVPELPADLGVLDAHLEHPGRCSEQLGRRGGRRPVQQAGGAAGATDPVGRRLLHAQPGQRSGPVHGRLRRRPAAPRSQGHGVDSPSVANHGHVGHRRVLGRLRAPGEPPPAVAAPGRDGAVGRPTRPHSPPPPAGQSCRPTGRSLAGTRGPGNRPSAASGRAPRHRMDPTNGAGAAVARAPRTGPPPRPCPGPGHPPSSGRSTPSHPWSAMASHSGRSKPSPEPCRPGRRRRASRRPVPGPDEGPHPLAGGQAVEEIGGRAAQIRLVGREVEVHGGEA